MTALLKTLRRNVSIYGAFAAMVPKELFQYNLWFWAEYVAQILSMIIYAFFWRAVYASAETPLIAGLTVQQTINYILLARIFAPLVETRLIFQFGFVIQSGHIIIELLRPTDFQARRLVISLTDSVVYLISKAPLFILAWLIFGLQFSGDWRAWVLFVVTLFLGQLIIFFFDWSFASLAFYTTETWGLSVVRVGVAQFFSGALVPLVMMPGWLQTIAAALPFAQAIAVPLGFFSGVTPISDAPRILLIQLLWLVGLAIVSRLIFNVAVRKVTVQGG